VLGGQSSPPTLPGDSQVPGGARPTLPGGGQTYTQAKLAALRQAGEIASAPFDAVASAAKRFFCGKSPSGGILDAMAGGALKGAAAGGYEGFTGGEVAGGFSGPGGAILGGFVGATIGASAGALYGSVTAGACSLAGAYVPQ
jgi:hypothetical protein